jgi:hypothetical protein
MAQTPIYERVFPDALHWEGFPRILWETIREVGYATLPLFEVVSSWDQGIP